MKKHPYLRYRSRASTPISKETQEIIKNGKNQDLCLRAVIILIGTIIGIGIAFGIQREFEHLQTAQQTTTVKMQIVEKLPIIKIRGHRHQSHYMRLKYQGHDFRIAVPLDDYQNSKIGGTIECKHMEGSDIVLSLDNKGDKGEIIAAFLLLLGCIYATIKFQNFDNC
jgi:hypothetical protein